MKKKKIKFFVKERCFFLKMESKPVDKKKNELPKFDPIPLAVFFCQYFNVSDLSEIKPFGPVAAVPPAYSLSRDTNLAIKATYKGQLKGEDIVNMTMTPTSNKLQPKEPFIHTKTGQPCLHDLNNAMIVNVSLKHYKFFCGSSKEFPKNFSVGVRLNFDHEHLAKYEGTDIHDQLTEAAGGISRIFEQLKPTDENGKDLPFCIPIYEAGYGYTNSDFTRTMALLNEDNIKRGVIELPRDVCLAARLNVHGLRKEPTLSDQDLEKMFSGMKLDNVEEEKQKAREQFHNQYQKQIQNLTPTQTFFAIPDNHVLSWPFKCADYATENRVQFETFEGDNPSCPKYYLVPDVGFNAWFNKFKELWLDKVDKRPLTSIGLQLVPIGLDLEETVNVEIEITTYIHYWTYPTGLTMDSINKLLPILSPTFPTADQWCLNSVATMVKEEEQTEEDKVRGGGGGARIKKKN